MEKVKQWVLYILECKDGTLYTGITNDLAHRLSTHRAGKGAKYTRGRGPLTLRYLEACEDMSHALQREAEIKKMTRKQKQVLCQSALLPEESEVI